MPRFSKLILLTVALLSLSACGTTHQAYLEQSSNQLAVVDPDDNVFHAAVQSYLAQNHMAPSSQYEYVRQDLDGDGRRDAIVMFESPFYSWCNSDGCKMLVMKASNDGFSVVSEIAPVRGPLLVSNARTNGWRDLIVRVSGHMDMSTKDVAMRYDGRCYPSQPAEQPALPAVIAMADLNGTQIFP